MLNFAAENYPPRNVNMNLEMLIAKQMCLKFFEQRLYIHVKAQKHWHQAKVRFYTFSVPTKAIIGIDLSQLLHFHLLPCP